VRPARTGPRVAPLVACLAAALACAGCTATTAARPPARPAPTPAPPTRVAAQPRVTRHRPAVRHAEPLSTYVTPSPPAPTHTATPPALPPDTAKYIRVTTPVTIRVRATDDAALDVTLSVRDPYDAMLHLDWGDGAGDGRMAVDCGPMVEGQPYGHREEPPGPTWRGPFTDTFRHAFRRAGTYYAVLTVQHQCAGPDHVANHRLVKIVVTPGPDLSNGRLAPSASGGPVYDQPGTFYVDGYDGDGFVTEVAIDWGDGSPVSRKSFARSACHDPVFRWPDGSGYAQFTHHYATPAPHHAKALVVSAGCDGRDVQRATGSVWEPAP
jgi:hypothetical protein